MDLAICKSFLQSLLFPQTCVLCERWVCKRNGSPVCVHCLEQIPPLETPACEICGSPVPSALREDAFYWCTPCQDQRNLSFNRCRCWGFYENQLRKLVQAYKYQGQKNLALDLAEFLSRSYLKHFSDVKIDYLVPVPSHKKRIKGRGFDHIALLVKNLSTRIRIPHREDLIVKIRDTRPQKGLSLSERKMNLRNVFKIPTPERFRGRNILIIDDVLTTGTTITEVASTLRQQTDAQFIGVLTIGRVPRRYR